MTWNVAAGEESATDPGAGASSVDTTPVDPVMEYAVGIGDLTRENFEDAKWRFVKSARSSSDPVLTMRSVFLVGWCCYNLKEWVKSAEWFGAYIKRGGPLDEYAAYYRGICLTLSGNHGEAVTAWEDFFKKYPTSRWEYEGRLTQADSLAELNRCRESLNPLSKLLADIKNGNQRARLILKIAECHEATGKKETALSKYREIYIYRPDSGSAPKAAERIKKLGGDPEKMSHEERYSRAEKLYDAARWKDALAEYQKLLNDKGFDKGDERGRLTAIRRAMCLYRMYSTKEAAAAFKSVYTDLPNGAYTSTAYYYYGHCMGRLERTDEAMASYRNVIEKTPKSSLVPGAWMNIAQIYIERGEWEKAIECMNKIKSGYSRKAAQLDVPWRIGWIYYRRGDYVKAAMSFEAHNAKRDIDSRRDTYWHARALEKMGATAEAKTLYRQLVDEKPFGYYAIWAWARLGKEALSSPPVATDEAKIQPQVRTIPNLSVKDERLDRSRELSLMGLMDFAVLELAHFEGRKDLTKDDHEAICLMYQSFGDYYRARRAVYRYMSIDTDKYKRDDDRYWRILYPQAYMVPVTANARERNLDPNHIWSMMMQESNFQRKIISSAGAMGLMQIIRPTAKQMAGRLGIKGYRESMLTDPSVNIRMGVHYLADVADRMGTHPGRLYLATAGYNGGPMNVKRWSRARPDLEIDEWVEEIPFKETRNYVKRVFANRSVYQMLYGKGQKDGIPAPINVTIKDVAPDLIK